jgi:hypothetical protein
MLRNVLFTLSKLSKASNNYKTTREALTQLRKYRVPPKFQSIVDISSLEIRAKPYSDVDEFLPVCYSCSTTNPILGAHACVHCGAEFIYSFLSFGTFFRLEFLLLAFLDVLPIVEFSLHEGISEQEASDLIKAEPPMNTEPVSATLLISEHRVSLESAAKKWEKLLACLLFFVEKCFGFNFSAKKFFYFIAFLEPKQRRNADFGPRRSPWT